MRILYFTLGYTAHDHRFLAKLAQTGDEVGYLRLESRPDMDDASPLPDGIRALTWAGGRRPARWLDFPGLRGALKHVLEEFDPEVVHAGPIQKCAFLTAWAGFPALVSMSWGSDILADAVRGAGRWLAGYTLQRSASFVCDCQAVREQAVCLGMIPQHIAVFPWGVDLQHFSPGGSAALRQQLGWEDSFVVLSTRAWEPLYGIDVLVGGFLEAAQQAPDVRLLMLDDGSLREQVRAWIRRAGMADRVHFAGRVSREQLPAYYRAADVYLSASRSDGSSVSLLEAMACGVPAIVSDIPANQEWVQPDWNGWWFERDQSRQLAERILAARDFGAGLRALGERARQVAEERADWDRNFPRLLEAYWWASRERAHYG